MIKPSIFGLFTFLGKSTAAPPDQMPPGMNKKHLRVKHTVSVHEVWLCQSEEGKKINKDSKKIRLLHQALGPTSEQQCADFIRLWREDAPVQPPPECTADGKKLKPPADHDELDFGDARIV